jgi:hypothetical protein
MIVVAAAMATAIVPFTAGLASAPPVRAQAVGASPPASALRSLDALAVHPTARSWFSTPLTPAGACAVTRRGAA